MDITEVRIKLMENSEDRLRAFCSITFDSCFVVRDLKIIDGANGPFVAMPSRKLTGHCGRCGHKNHLRANFCNQCGAKQRIHHSNHEGEAAQKLYADVAHPINSVCREKIQHHVIDEFDLELERAQQPGYRSRYDDDFDIEDMNSDYIEEPPAPKARTSPKPSALPKQSPPEPHFNKAPRTSGNANGENDADGDDSFGAGIL